MSDTPRTDAKTQYPIDKLPDRQLRYLDMCDHARALERENATLTAEVERKQAALVEFVRIADDRGAYLTLTDLWEVIPVGRRAVLPVGLDV